MTANERGPDTGRKRDRFIIHDGEIEITGRHAPSPEEQEEADRVFNRILKNRKKGEQ